MPSTECPHCKATLSVPTAAIGRTCVCPNCRIRWKLDPHLVRSAQKEEAGPTNRKDAQSVKTPQKTSETPSALDASDQTDQPIEPTFAAPDSPAPTAAPESAAVVRTHRRLKRYGLIATVTLLVLTGTYWIGSFRSKANNSLDTASPLVAPKLDSSTDHTVARNSGDGPNPSPPAVENASGRSKSAQAGAPTLTLPPGPIPPAQTSRPTEPVGNHGSPGDIEQWASDLPNIIKQVEPSVVRINVFFVDRESYRLGSGFLVDEKGTIATNYHVIEGADRAEVVYLDGTISSIDGYLAIDTELDLALLRVEDRQNLPTPLSLATQAPQKGQDVFVIGAPRGYDFTVSKGIVSAVRNSIEDDLLRALHGENATVIQTTAATSPGNSGGPLLNMRGEVVGVNSSGRPDAQNLNFAISVTHLSELLRNAGPIQPLASLPKPPVETRPKAGLPEDVKSAALEIVYAKRDELLAKKRAAEIELKSRRSKMSRTDGELTRFHSRMRGLTETIASLDAQIERLSSQMLRTFDASVRYQLQQQDASIRRQRQSYYDEWQALKAKADGLRVVRQEEASQIAALTDELKRIALESSHLEQEWFKLVDPWGTLAQGNFAQVEANLTLWIFLNSRSALPHVARGYAYTIAGRFREAMDDYRRAQELEPKLASIYWYRGWSYMQQNKPQDALRDFNRCEELNSSYPHLFHWRGRCHWTLERYHLAIRDYRRAIADDPQSYYSHRDLAQLLATCPDDSRRDPGQALTHAKKACELTSWSEWSSLEALALASAKTGDLPAAVKWQTRALELAPESERKQRQEYLESYQRRLNDSQTPR